MFCRQGEEGLKIIPVSTTKVSESIAKILEIPNLPKSNSSPAIESDSNEMENCREFKMKCEAENKHRDWTMLKGKFEIQNPKQMAINVFPASLTAIRNRSRDIKEELFEKPSSVIKKRPEQVDQLERVALQRRISELETHVRRVSDQGIETSVRLEKQIQDLKTENVYLREALELSLTKIRQWNQEMIRAGIQQYL
jgi:hypothetical protein